MRRQEKYWIECQQCGVPVREVSNETRIDMSHSPYRYIEYCGECKRSGPDRRETP